MKAIQLSNTKIYQAVEETLMYLLAFVFAYTAVMKFKDLAEFKAKLVKSTLIANEFAPLLTYAVPIFEVVLVAMLLVEKTKKAGAYLSLLTLSFFTFYLIALNNFTVYNGCSCGGIFEFMTFEVHLVVNVVLALFALTIILLQDKVTKK